MLWVFVSETWIFFSNFNTVVLFDTLRKIKIKKNALSKKRRSPKELLKTINFDPPGSHNWHRLDINQYPRPLLSHSCFVANSAHMSRQRYKRTSCQWCSISIRWCCWRQPVACGTTLPFQLLFKLFCLVYKFLICGTGWSSKVFPLFLIFAYIIFNITYFQHSANIHINRSRIP